MTAPRPFAVLGLPRSRTKWISEFLSYRGVVCYHDPLQKFGTVAMVAGALRAPGHGLASTGLVTEWQELARAVPRLRFAVVRRPMAEVTESLLRIGAPVRLWALDHQQRMLEELGARRETEVFEFGRLGEEAHAGRLFRWVFGRALDRAWWEHWRGTNVQVDVGATLRALRGAGQ